MAENQNCIFYKEYDIGHIGFLMPNETDRRQFVEMLEIIKHFNKLYQPVPVQGYEKPWQQEILAQIEMEVVKNITHMSSYKPDQQRLE